MGSCSIYTPLFHERFLEGSYTTELRVNRRHTCKCRPNGAQPQAAVHAVIRADVGSVTKYAHGWTQARQTHGHARWCPNADVWGLHGPGDDAWHDGRHAHDACRYDFLSGCVASGCPHSRVFPGQYLVLLWDGAGSPEQMMGYMPNNMRPYSQPMAYGMMPGQYDMMYGHQMNQHASNARPPMYSQGYQAPMHPAMQQAPSNQAMSGSLERQSSAGTAHLQHSSAGK